MPVQKQKPWTTLCIIVIAIGYGVPLARSYARGQELKRDKGALAEALINRIEHDRGSMARVIWLDILSYKVGGDTARTQALRLAASPNHMMRSFAVFILMKYYRDDPQAVAIINSFITNPREIMWQRYMPLNFDFPAIKKTDAGRKALAVIESQRDLFPADAGYFPPPPPDPQ
ncbi:hypothetical protein IT570_06285 [Candidatus Sumerlaeota bacterium]|nr:hypothetical protein [Candidatus Sumerlaeota bacterium]